MQLDARMNAFLFEVRKRLTLFMTPLKPSECVFLPCLHGDEVFTALVSLSSLPLLSLSLSPLRGRRQGGEVRSASFRHSYTGYGNSSNYELPRPLPHPL